MITNNAVTQRTEYTATVNGLNLKLVEIGLGNQIRMVICIGDGIPMEFIATDSDQRDVAERVANFILQTVQLGRKIALNSRMSATLRNDPNTFGNAQE